MSAPRSNLQLFLLGLGILAVVWGLLSPLLVFLPLYYADTARDAADKTNAFDAARVGEAMFALGPSAAAGLLGLIGMGLLTRGKQVGRALLGVSALGLLALSVFTAATLGKFLFPPALLFTFPTLWYGETKQE